MGNEPPFEAFVDDPRDCVTQPERAPVCGRSAGGRNSRGPGRPLDLGHNRDTSSILNGPKEAQTIPIRMPAASPAAWPVAMQLPIPLPAAAARGVGAGKEGEEETVVVRSRSSSSGC
jgi:hypothetical protein